MSLKLNQSEGKEQQLPVNILSLEQIKVEVKQPTQSVVKLHVCLIIQCSGPP